MQTIHQDTVITLAHGNGGKYSWDLIHDLFMQHFTTTLPKQGNDAAELALPGQRIAMTTDSFVVSPLTFAGGDIGKLAVCGTINDLVTAGAIPRYLTCGLILEEGLPIVELERIIASMAQTAAACGVEIVTGDTKVVQRGAADQIFINTTGIGMLRDGLDLSADRITQGDQVIVTGNVGDHGCAILLARESFSFGTDICSDCAPLNGLLEDVFATGATIHVLRDPTRGGVAATLNELALQSGTGIILREDQIPVQDPVRGVCEMLGLDPLYLANEGKMLIIAPPDATDPIMQALTNHPLGVNARVIGEVVETPPNRVLLQTAMGKRILDMPTIDQLPRIC